MTLLSMTMQGQTYTALWQQADEAAKKDLPRTRYDVLMKIVKKAQKEGQYGQLMAAELAGSRVMAEVAPDSLQPAVDRIEARRQQAADKVLAVVYATVLKKIYDDNSELERNGSTDVTLDAETCAKLAAVKAADYEPLTVKGADSRWFGDDMLSVVGYQLNDYRALHDYYSQAGNRVAALMTALETVKQGRTYGRKTNRQSSYIQTLDSLIAQYGDLPEAGEIAIERYNYMNDYTDASAEEKWAYLQEALNRWGSYRRASELCNAQQELSKRTFEVLSNNRLVFPGSQGSLHCYALRNITGLTMRIYKAKVNANHQLAPNNDKDYKQLKPLLTEMPELRMTRQYSGKQPYEVFEDTIALPTLPVGAYLIELESTPGTEVARQFYYVSNVRVMQEALPDKQVRYVVVDATEGQPIKGATIELSAFGSGQSKQKLATLTTDGKGEATFKYDKKTPSYVYAYTATDKFCPPLGAFHPFYYYDNQRRVEQTQLFTDRAIYRPGQTVHVAAICYEVTNGIDQKALEGKKLKLTLRDANGKTVAEQTVTTDRYGSCATDFTLPSTGLTGAFTIQTANGSCLFRVEEYKRPTFEVEFDKVTQNYQDGDTVVVKATARSYAGVPVQGGKVSYKVVRRRALWWWAPVDEAVVAEGTAATGSDGTFTIAMPMVLPQADGPLFYNFVCLADVTDQAGETHQGQVSLPLGNRKAALGCDLPKQVRADQLLKVTFHLRNAAGNDIEAAVTFRFDNGKWQSANTQQPVAVGQQKSGRHTLEAICEGDTLKHEYVVFSLDDKRPAIETDDWFYVSHEQFPNDGTPVTVQVGSSAKNVHIVYSIISGNKVIESGAVERSDELLNRKLTYKDEYANGLVLTFAWVKQGKAYEHKAQIRRPMPDKELKLEWRTFRDRLTPGQQEEWALTVKKPDGTAADAQLMATLYDKSLDQIATRQWGFTPYQYIPLPTVTWVHSVNGTMYFRGNQKLNLLNTRAVSLTHFDGSLFPQVFFRRGNVQLLRSAKMMATADMAMMKEEAEDEAAPAAGNIFTSEQDVAIGTWDVAGTEGGAEAPVYVPLRENLQETAFFYPQLTTDAEGVVTMKFTLPESLTTWRFTGLAHTPDLYCGTLEGEAVAKKALMVQPNVPRFVREGDQATITARVINTSDRALSGTAWLTLIDPETEKEVVKLSEPFAVEAGETGTVTFKLAPLTAEPSLLIARVTAAGDGFSDGEQHYLPVLPNRERVIVTMPFTQNGPGTQTIDLTKLFGNSQQPKLTIEYTNNPAWLMVQALPTVGHPHDDCAVCQAAALYANSIGQHLISQVPQAKQLFEQWKRETGSEPSLQSQLQKNQELKDLVLDETPWVADADREEEQRQRLADFFDANTMQLRLTSAVDKLGKLQQADGSWSWWPEMPGSTYMTVAVTEMLVRQKALTGQLPTEAMTMLDRSVKYLGKEMVKLVDDLKKQEKKGRKASFPGRNALQWLYICKLDGRKLPTDVQQANAYLTTLLKKETTKQSIYEKALSAIILDNQTYIKSLKEYTVYNEEMGRYYDTPRADYSWRDYRIPTQVAAIEAIQRLTPNDQQTLDEMRRWLLQEKRTQAWDTPLNSVDAVYAFLSGATDVLTTQTAQSTLKLDGTPLDLPKATAGIGYVKTAQTYHGEKTFTAEKSSDSTSWGAVYAQFIQPTSDIKDQASGVSVQREVLTEGGKSPATLQVGDRIKVRLTIKSERDLDFVQLQDKRAACMEPVNQLSGYRNGYYVTPRDNVTNYYFDRLAKGKHVIETEYYIDRAGQYETGTCTVQCAYAPEYRGTTKSQTVKVNNEE